MKRIIFCVSLLINTWAAAGTSCFLLQENDKILQQEGVCDVQYAPCSTFKIALSLIGYNEGLLKNEVEPEFPFEEGYVDDIDIWKQAHNPSTWMKNSCVWYSQLLTQKLGNEKFDAYVKELHYGNQDTSGDSINGLRQGNGLTRCWLSSSLKISPQEQMAFLQKLVHNKLPVSQKSQDMTKRLLFVEELSDGWTLYGKTGSGCLLKADGTPNRDRQIGWFIGWIHKDERSIVFVHFIQDDTPQKTRTSLRAKAAAKEKLKALIQSLAETNRAFKPFSQD